MRATASQIDQIKEFRAKGLTYEAIAHKVNPPVSYYIASRYSKGVAKPAKGDQKVKPAPQTDTTTQPNQVVDQIVDQAQNTTATDQTTPTSLQGLPTIQHDVIGMRVALALAKSGITPSKPLLCGTAYELIADNGSDLVRIKVEEATIKNGILCFDKMGGSVDIYAIYDKRNDIIYWVPADEKSNKLSLKDRKNSKMPKASDYQKLVFASLRPDQSQTSSTHP